MAKNWCKYGQKHGENGHNEENMAKTRRIWPKTGGGKYGHNGENMALNGGGGEIWPKRGQI